MDINNLAESVSLSSRIFPSILFLLIFLACSCWGANCFPTHDTLSDWSSNCKRWASKAYLSTLAWSWLLVRLDVLKLNYFLAVNQRRVFSSWQGQTCKGRPLNFSHCVWGFEDYSTLPWIRWYSIVKWVSRAVWRPILVDCWTLSIEQGIRILRVYLAWLELLVLFTSRFLAFESNQLSFSLLLSLQDIWRN